MRIAVVWCVAAIGCAGESVSRTNQGEGVTTIVSLTFDDTFADQFQVGSMVGARGLHATFFINSGRVNLAGSMTQGQLLAMQQDGNEIAGHTVSHADLPTLDSDEQKRQICNDRVSLLDLGFAVTDFAYPFGDATAETEQIVSDCGYNSARGVGGIVSPGSCIGCAFADPVPPSDILLVKTPDSIKVDTTLDDLERYVTQAEDNGGGWVPLVFHHVCDGCNQLAVSPSTLAAFLDWLAPRSANGTTVQTVHDVIGGPLQPGVPGPAGNPPPGAGNLLQNPSLETDGNGDGIPDCWQRGGSGTNTATYALVSDAADGNVAQRIDVTSLSSGARRLVSRQDLGTCAPAAYPGHSYTVTASYHATASSVFSVYYRTASGGWVWFAQSPVLAATASYTQASYTTPPLPAGATAISVGLSLTAVGSITMDAFSLVDTDTTPPVVSIDTPADGATVAGTVTLSATASDAGGMDHVDFLIDAVVVGTARGPFSIAWDSTAETDAVVGLTARAVDLAGNVTLSTSRLITVANAPPIDTTPPTASVTAPAEGDVVHGTVTLRADAADNVAVQHVDFLVGGLLVGTADVAPYEVAWDSTHTADGPIEITARAVDTSGNVALSAAVHATLDNTVGGDTTPPVTTVACDGAPCASGFYAAPIVVTLTASDDSSGVAQIAFSLDGSDPSLVYTDPFSVASSATLEVAATDVAGNREATQTIAIAIDAAVPTVTLTCNGAACATGFYNQPIAITLTASSGGASGIAAIRYTLDGSDPTTGLVYTGPFAISTTTTVRYVAISGAGVASAIGSQLVQIDTIAPTAAVSSPAPGAVVTGIAPIVANVSDNVAVTRVRFYLDGKQLGTRIVTPFRWNWDTSTATKGAHTVSVQAEDAAGNATRTASVAVTVQ